MKTIILSVATIILGLQMLNASTAAAAESKVPESVAQAVVESEKQQPEQEKTEEGEASGNVQDCEQQNDASDAEDGVDKKNLDDCEAMVK